MERSPLNWGFHQSKGNKLIKNKNHSRKELIKTRTVKTIKTYHHIWWWFYPCNQHPSGLTWLASSADNTEPSLTRWDNCNILNWQYWKILKRRIFMVDIHYLLCSKLNNTEVKITAVPPHFFVIVIATVCVCFVVVLLHICQFLMSFILLSWSNHII